MSSQSFLILSFRVKKDQQRCIILTYTTLTNLSMKYLMMCKVYTDVGGVK